MLLTCSCNLLNFSGTVLLGCRLAGRPTRHQELEVLGAGLDHVGPSEHAPKPRPVGLGIADHARPAVRIHHEQQARGQPLGERLERRRRRLEDEPEAAHLDGRHALEASRKVVDLVARGRRPCRVEAVLGGPVGTDLGHRQGRRIVRPDGQREVDAVGGQVIPQQPTEPVGREPPHERGRLAEPADGPGDVVRPAPRHRRQPAVRVLDDIDQGFASDQDRHGRNTSGASPSPRAEPAARPAGCLPRPMWVLRSADRAIAFGAVWRPEERDERAVLLRVDGGRRAVRIGDVEGDRDVVVAGPVGS